MHVCSECGQGYERAGYCAADGHPLEVVTDPVLGTEVLRYRLARLIGRGGMGNVYLGVQPHIGSRVAVKVLSQECAREPELVERFFQEARAVNLIKHENIVSVIDMARLPDGRPFIVMEYIEGVTLAKVITNGRAPLGGIVQVMSDVLSALDAAHAIGIVHRDLKPDNILITGKGHARVLDFGIAKLAPALRAHEGARTETGALLGTPAYMAPEQISGRGEIDGRTDVYAAGIVLFEAVTGRVPFAGATLFDMMRAQLEDDPPHPRALREDLPEPMEAVILTALAKDPAMRFQSAAAMANALEQASAGLPQEQWRELSTRSAPLSRGSAPRVRRPTTEPPPMTYRHRDTPPAISAVNVPKVKSPPVKRSKRPYVLVALAMAVTGVVGAVIATAAQRGDDKPAVVVANETPPVVETKQVAIPIAVTVDASVTAEAPAAPPSPPAAPPPPRAKQQSRAPRPVAVPVQPPATQAADRSLAEKLAEPTGADAARAKIADEYKMHRDHVALPGEVPIKRRPRMSRGKFNATSFDYRAFMPQALKLARAEFPDAQLAMFEVHGVAPDGLANIAIDDKGAQFTFMSKTGVDEGCVVTIDIRPKKQAIETYVEGGGMWCNADPTPPPRCTLARVWEKMQVMGTGATRATITYNRNGWIFGGSDRMQSLPDDCSR